MKNALDNALNHISMYRLALYYVAVLLLAAFGLGFFGIVPHDPTALAFSAVFIGGVCWITNRLLAVVFRVPVNVESIYITALILILIMPPVVATDMAGLEGLALASIAAIASKFLLAIHRKHVFNPVAIGVFLSALVLDQPATWWVGGNMALLPLVLVPGLIVAYKVQRFGMVATYVAANLAVTLAMATPEMYGEALSQALVYSPLLFAGFAMLTEPLTAPQSRVHGFAFGAIVGLLSAPNVHIGDYYSTPEAAFLIGNIFAFAVSPKYRYMLTLLRVEKMASGCYDFVFRSNHRLAFKAGQYLDWTMEVKNPDNRGNRRPFTVASAPSGNEVRLGVKFYKAPSAFKRSMLAMRPGDVVFGSQVAGSFTLPKDKSKKLAFIAGGIGVTPFRSMVEDMVNRREAPPVVMFYGNNSIGDIAYAELFDRAERELGIKTVYAVVEDARLDTNMHRGFIDAALIRREMPDFQERTFYISGPRAMVLGFQGVLKQHGISRSRIKVDFFPGFA